MIEIHWSAAVEHDADFLGPIVKNWTSLLPPWAGMPSTATLTVQTICEAYFDDRVWGEWFGEDYASTVRVKVHEPRPIVGEYIVNLERVVKAQARKAP